MQGPDATAPDGLPRGAKPWYEAAFEARYLDVYAHRDDASARREVEGLLQRGLAPEGARVLDLACGAGRHARALFAAGRDVVGLDLSADLLARARSADEARLAGRLVRGDVRHLPFRAGAFDAVTMLFSSWGYFDDGDNERVLAAIQRVLRPDATLVLDLMNAARIRSTLVPESRDEREGRVLVQRRSLTQDGRRVVKHVELTEPDGTTRAWHEDVRLFDPEELDALLARHGLHRTRLEGDFDGRPFDPDSPRMIAWACPTSAAVD